MEPEQAHTVFIGNLPKDAVEGEIVHIFSGIEIKTTRMMYNRETSEFKGFAFVEFNSADDLQKALELDGALYDDNPLRINIAEPSNNRRSDMRSRGRGFQEDRRGRGFQEDRRGRGFQEDRRGRGYQGDRNDGYDRRGRRFEDDHRPMNQGDRGSRPFQDRPRYPSRGASGTDLPRQNRGEHGYREQFGNQPQQHTAFKPQRGFFNNDMSPRDRFNRGSGNFEQDRRQSSSDFRQSRDFDDENRGSENAMSSTRRSSFNGRRRTFFRGGNRNRGRSDVPPVDVVPSNDPARKKLVLTKSSPEELEAKQKIEKEAEDERRAKLFEAKKSDKGGSEDSSKKEDSTSNSYFSASSDSGKMLSKDGSQHGDVEDSTQAPTTEDGRNDTEEATA